MRLEELDATFRGAIDRHLAMSTSTWLGTGLVRWLGNPPPFVGSYVHVPMETCRPSRLCQSFVLVDGAEAFDLCAIDIYFLWKRVSLFGIRCPSGTSEPCDPPIQADVSMRRGYGVSWALSTHTTRDTAFDDCRQEPMDTSVVAVPTDSKPTHDINVQRDSRPSRTAAPRVAPRIPRGSAYREGSSPTSDM